MQVELAIVPRPVESKAVALRARVVTQQEGLADSIHVLKEGDVGGGRLEVGEVLDVALGHALQVGEGFGTLVWKDCTVFVLWGVRSDDCLPHKGLVQCL